MNIAPNDERVVHFPRSDGSRIPFKVFSSPEIYRREQERIFRGPVWSFVAVEAEIPEPHDFKSTFVGDTLIKECRPKYNSCSLAATPENRPHSCMT